jgi:hypothetical protein
MKKNLITSKKRNKKHDLKNNESNLLKFGWQVELGGYEWESLKTEDKSPAILPRRVFGRFEIDKATNQFADINFNVKSYDPFTEYPTLYRKFAELSEDKKDILGFANKYGMLGIGKELCLNDGTLINGELYETYTQWQQEINSLNFLLKLWDNLDNIEFLRKRIFWRHTYVYFADGSNKWLEAEKSTCKYWDEVKHIRPKDGLIYHDLDAYNKRKRFINYPADENPFRFHVLDKNDDPVLFKDWENKNSLTLSERDYKFVKKPATILFTKLFNLELEKHQIKQLLKHIEVGNNKSQFDIELIPDSLLGAMYIQFHGEIIGKKKIFKCKHCKKYSDVTYQGRGRKREYCPNCRQNHWYDENKEELKAKREANKLIGKEVK